MSKNIKENVLKKIKTNHLVVRPRWVFYLASVVSALGLIVASTFTVLSLQLYRFRLTHPGIGAARKLDFILTSLPWYIPVLAIVGLISGYLLLKRYDFSYQKNLGVIAIFIALGIVISSLMLDRLGLNDFMIRRGYFRQIYGHEQGWGQMNHGR